MKKVISIIITAIALCMTSSTASADVTQLIDSVHMKVVAFKDSAVAEVKSIDTSSAFKTMYQDFKTGILAIASSLKLGAEHVYMVLVKQQIVNAIVYLLLFAGGIVLGWIWLKRYKDIGENWYNEREDFPTFLGIFRGVQLLLGVVMLLIGIFHVDVITMGFVNPEYGAMKEIIDMVKTLKH